MDRKIDQKERQDESVWKEYRKQDCKVLLLQQKGCRSLLYFHEGRLGRTSKDKDLRRMVLMRDVGKKDPEVKTTEGWVCMKHYQGMSFARACLRVSGITLGGEGIWTDEEMNECMSLAASYNLADGSFFVREVN